MSEPVGFFFWGSVDLVVGALILVNLEAIVRVDQSIGLRLKSWLNKKLGKSPLNRALWSVGTPSGVRSSRIVLRIAGIVFLVLGGSLVGLALRDYFFK